MKSYFDLFCRFLLLVVAVRLAATPTIEISTGPATSRVRMSLPMENRVAVRAPQAPDLATAYWVVTPLPVVVPPGFGYYGAVRSINAQGDVLGNDLSLIKHVAADGAVTPLGGYNFHHNGGRQLDDTGRVILNERFGNDGFLFKVTGNSLSQGIRYAGTKLTSLDNAGGVLGVTLSEVHQSDPDYWGTHFVERGDRRRELELPADSNFGADLMALNERDEVVGGAFQIPSNWWRGLYLKPGRPPRWLPGYRQYEDVYNLNVHGQLVGSTGVPAGFGYAPGVYPALWDSGAVGRVKVLDTDRSLFGGESGWAWAANRWGHIVGRTRSGGALWLNGQPHELTGRIINPDNVRLDYFADINDKGEIVGAEHGIRTTPGSRAFIMRPVWPSLAVDLNRDGKIALPTDGDKSDVTSPTMPFRFWINDDDDVDTDELNDVERAPISRADSDDDRIDGIRDLEDFARLNLYLGGLGETVLNGKVAIGLKWKSVAGGTPAIKVWRNLSPNGGTEYLYDEAIARQHLDLRAPGQVHGSMPYLIPKEFWQQSEIGTDRPYGHLLFEGTSEGDAQLAITFHKADGTEICEGPAIWLDLKNIKRMYQRVKALADGGDDITVPSELAGPDDNNIPRPAMSWTDDASGYPFTPDPRETKTCIVSVHGWNQTYERATMYAETAFKRLWHRGYKGRFVSFRWPTYVGLLTYNNSEYKAWKCGESLQQYLDSIPRGSGGFTVNLIAHSMGNIVAGEALRRGASVENYALWNAAVPSICYDGRYELDQGWGFVHPNDDPDAYTRSLSYRDRFAGVGGRLINFYLEEDSALGLWRLNNSTSKPQRWTSGFVAGYGYNRSAVSGRKLFLEFWTAFGRNMVDDHESMSYAVRSPTLAVGSDSGLVDSLGSSYGSVVAEIDMDDEYGFDKDHSAQFLYAIQKTKALYDQTLIEFRLPVLP